MTTNCEANCVASVERLVITMKLLLAFFAAICITGVYSGNTREKVEILECFHESKVDMKLFDEVRTNPNFVPTREMQCFGACLLKKKNLMDNNGKYTEAFDKTEFDKTCKSQYGKDDCETAGKLMTCLSKNAFDIVATKVKGSA